MPSWNYIFRAERMRSATSGASFAALRAAAVTIPLTLCALPLAGCGGDRVIATATTPPDYRARHPIVIGESDYSLDLFPTGPRGNLDSRSIDRLREFANRYQELGHGPVSVLVPSGGPYNPAESASLAYIRQIFAAAGSRGVLAVAPYPVTDPTLASPVRISFEGIKARVPHRCGDWPNDLASGSTAQGWENKTWWNFGCANQSTFAAQVADPRDLAGPRGERPADTNMRIRAIESVRKGIDPGTKWETKNIGLSGGGG